MSERDPLTPISEDIYQLRLPLPFALNHVNVYLLRGDNGWTILDTGIHWKAGEESWRYGFAKLDIRPNQIEKIVLTHFHPDHFGMAGWLQGLAADAGKQVDIHISEREDQNAELVWRNNTNMDFGAWLRFNGLPASFAETVDASMGDTFRMTLPHPTPMKQIKVGEPVTMGTRTFQSIHAPGHSDGQLIFYDEADKLMLSGDHILMTITPNIGLWEHSDPNPLGNFMDSLREIRNLDVRLALPGHRKLIDDWAGRIEELLEHHDYRLGGVLESIEKGAKTPYEVTQKIFDTSRFTSHEWRFAIAETLAHLEFLQREGKIRKAEQEQIFEL
jgi:glyoxylase-like metal-dependent hydrolase (beta-lactamase superfamily II)